MLIEITSKTHPVLIDLKYATTDNFTSQVIYQDSRCFLRDAAMPFFEKAIELAAQQGYTFKILDAFRPQAAQYKLWDICPDPIYIANPDKGSNHSRGVAIDLTLCTQTGEELDMATPFDFFDVTSHHGGSISKEAAHNRYQLLGIMMSAGWDLYQSEWWHYQLFNAKSFSLLD